MTMESIEVKSKSMQKRIEAQDGSAVVKGEPPKVPDERAPDGLTKLDIRRLRTKYKKLKAKLIENDIDTLADPDAKSTEVLNRIKAREHLEGMLGIVSTKLTPEAGEDSTSLSAAIDALKESSEDVTGAPDAP